MSGAALQRRIERSLLYLLAIVASLIALFPVYWLVAMSFMPPMDTFAIPPKLVFTPTLVSYQTLFGGFSGVNVKLYVTNSLIAAGGSTALSLVIAIFGGYATARFYFPARNLVVGAILVTRMLPPIAMVVPMFLGMYRVGLLDTQIGLIIVYTALNIPFAFWMLHGFIKTVPLEIADAALVDGCTEITALFRVILPLIGPGLVAAAAFSFILAWNDFALAVVLTTSQAKTLPLLIQSFQGPEGTFWGPMAAGATIAIAPPVILLLIAQNWMVKGLTMGAAKG